jgi:hypothetical protein
VELRGDVLEQTERLEAYSSALDDKETILEQLNAKAAEIESQVKQLMFVSD